jgi:hypothetical protein
VKKKLALAGLLATLAATLFWWRDTASVIAVPTISTINHASFAKIEIGMTRQQVEKILGGPASQEDVGERIRTSIWPRDEPEIVKTCSWSERDQKRGEERLIAVEFGSAGKVNWKDFAVNQLDRPSTFWQTVCSYFAR